MKVLAACAVVAFAFPGVANSHAAAADNTKWPYYWQMVANAYGQAETKTIRKSLDDSIAKMSDHFDKYNAELSYIAGK